MSKHNFELIARLPTNIFSLLEGCVFVSFLIVASKPCLFTTRPTRQPDWVSTVAGCGKGQETFVTGCYDGYLRVYGPGCKVRRGSDSVLFVVKFKFKTVVCPFPPRVMRYVMNSKILCLRLMGQWDEHEWSIYLEAD